MCWIRHHTHSAIIDSQYGFSHYKTGKFYRLKSFWPKSCLDSFGYCRVIFHANGTSNYRKSLNAASAKMFSTANIFPFYSVMLWIYRKLQNLCHTVVKHPRNRKLFWVQKYCFCCLFSLLSLSSVYQYRLNPNDSNPFHFPNWFMSITIYVVWVRTGLDVEGCCGCRARLWHAPWYRRQLGMPSSVVRNFTDGGLTLYFINRISSLSAFDSKRPCLYRA